jgi:hypothetical protein
MRTERETFDAQSEVGRIRSLRADARRRLYRKSRLDRYRAELVAMKRAGASCADLAVWLRITHRCKINRNSIDRYLKKLPELYDGSCSAEKSEKSSCTRELVDCIQKK